MEHQLFTSESVAEGHPDKLADQISDAILDAILSQDPNSRVECNTMLTADICLLGGQITSNAQIDMPAIVRRTIEEVGYTGLGAGFDPQKLDVICAITPQSSDIAAGVNIGGAGDQGMMFGFACTETPELMPMPIMLAHKLVRRLAEVRKNGEIPYLRPDGKSEVTVEYDGFRPVRVDKVLVSTQHQPDIPHSTIYTDIVERVMKSAIPAEMLDDRTEFLVNPTGSFVAGGPVADTGLTGRKSEVDTYGSMARHGGGCFSGKDPTKVDRSAAYMMRYIAKNIVAAGLADRCEIQVAYAIGVEKPLSLAVNTFGTGKVSDQQIAERIPQLFDLTPRAMIERLQLQRPIYRPTAVFGAFGRTDLNLLWESTDAVKILQDAV